MHLYALVLGCFHKFLGVSNFIKSTIGVKLWCPLTPTLFGIYIDELESFLHEHIQDGAGAFFTRFLSCWKHLFWSCPGTQNASKRRNGCKMPWKCCQPFHTVFPSLAMLYGTFNDVSKSFRPFLVTFLKSFWAHLCAREGHGTHRKISPCSYHCHFRIK
jgi:hypothetical protein